MKVSNSENLIEVKNWDQTFLDFKIEKNCYKN